MKIFLAGTDLLKAYPNELVKSKYQLASFYSIQDWQLPFLNGCKEWLLDSGAFSFMNGKKQITLMIILKDTLNLSIRIKCSIFLS